LNIDVKMGSTISTTASSKPLQDYSVEDVATFVLQLGAAFREYAKVVRDNHVSGTDLASVETKEELDAMLVDLGVDNRWHRRVMVNRWREQTDGTSTLSPADSRDNSGANEAASSTPNALTKRTQQVSPSPDDSQKKRKTGDDDRNPAATRIVKQEVQQSEPEIEQQSGANLSPLLVEATNSAVCQPDVQPSCDTSCTGGLAIPIPDFSVFEFLP
jgi:hypothetical protein